MSSSWGVTLIIIAAVLVVIVVAATLVSRRNGTRTPKPGEPQRRRTYPDGERPEHLDPDPDRTAGGRAQFTPPSRGREP